MMALCSHHLCSLFDSSRSALIFCGYILLFVNQGLLVRASQTADNGYSYNTMSAVIITEFVKLTASLAFFLSRNKWHAKALLSSFLKHRNVLLCYLVPSGLYYLYNVLAYVNLSVFDTTTYFLLLQLRVVITGLLFPVVFGRRFTSLQWASVLLLTLGCVVKQIEWSPRSHPADVPGSEHSATAWLVGSVTLSLTHLPLIILQVFCSCFAGVYNEYLLKKGAADVDIWLQNAFMYTDSIVCGLLAMSCREAFSSSTTTNRLTAASWYSPLRDPLVLLLITNNATVGLVTSLFLRSLNSILKTFASSLELLLTALLSWMLFSVAIGWNTVVAVFLVSLSLYLYSHQPVQNPALATQFSTKPSEEKRDSEGLLV